MNLNREADTLYTCCSVRFLHISCPAAVLQTFEGFAADICRWDRPAFVQQIKYLKMLLKKITTSSCVDAVSALWLKHCTATEENADFV